MYRSELKVGGRGENLTHVYVVYMVGAAHPQLGVLKSLSINFSCASHAKENATTKGSRGLLMLLDSSPRHTHAHLL